MFHCLLFSVLVFGIPGMAVRLLEFIEFMSQFCLHLSWRMGYPASWPQLPRGTAQCWNSGVELASMVFQAWASGVSFKRGFQA
jgi:hypothetical protein